MIKTLLLIFSITFSTIPAWSVGSDTLSVYLQKLIQTEAKKECPSCSVKLRVLNDKVVEDIAIPDQVIADYWKGQTNLILVYGGKRKIVTVDIRWMDQVAIATKNIRQGQVIADSMISMVEKDVTYLKTPYSNSAEHIQGLVTKRVFQRGQIIDEAMLKKPIAIRFGQPIKVEYRQGPLQLVMQGKSRGAGAVGERIPIYIPKTKKRMTAEILNHERVKVQ